MNQQHPSDSLEFTFEGVQHPPIDQLTRVQTKIRRVQMGRGYLKIYSRMVNDQVLTEAFTLQSLAECMGLPAGTVEGRYHRGRLFNWKIDIPTGESRPVRGFPLPLLEQVMTILTTRGARVESTGNTDKVVGRQPKGDAKFPLVYEKHAGQQYITIPALADHYGRSTTAIRNRLVKSGLLAKAVNLNSPAQGGRPRRGWPVSLQAQLIDAIENGAHFFNEFQSAMARVQNSSLYRVPQAVQLPAGNPEAASPTLPASPDAFAQIEGLLKQAKPPRAPDHDTTQWAQRLHAARDKVWEFDAVIEEMRRAGLSDAQINEAVVAQYTLPAPSGQEHSEGVQA